MAHAGAVHHQTPAAKTAPVQAAPSRELDGFVQSHKYDDLISRASEKYGVDPTLIKAIICKESKFNPKAGSGAGAKGLMQMMPATAKALGVKDRTNPEQNVMAGTKYIGQLLKQYDGDETLALAAYNAGPGNVRKYDGVPPFKETRDYIPKVLAYRNEFAGDFDKVAATGNSQAATSDLASLSQIGTRSNTNQCPVGPNFNQMLASLTRPATSNSASLATPQPWMLNWSQGFTALASAQDQASLLRGMAS